MKKTLPAFLLVGLLFPLAASPAPGPSGNPAALSLAIPQLPPHQAVRVHPGADLTRVPRVAALDGRRGHRAWGGPALASAAKAYTFAELGTNESLSQLQQATTVLEGGGYGVVWEEGTFPSRDVRMQWLAPDGTFVFQPGGILIAEQAEDEFNAVIVPRQPAGACVALVRAPAGGGGESQIIVRAFDATGAPLWASAGVPASELLPDEGQVTPNLLPHPSGGVFVCFGVFNFLFAHDLRCQLLDELGARQWGAAGQGVGVTG